MRKFLCLILLLITFQIRAQQDNAPVIGVSDKRIDAYGLKNARVFVDYQTTLDNTDILISDGHLEAIGTKLVFPKGIIAAISFGKRYGVKKMVLNGADESSWAVKDSLKENNTSVLLADPLSISKYDYCDTRLPFKLAAMFRKEGILMGMTYSKQAYGNLPFAASHTVAYGLTKEEALQTVTLNNAKILGIDDIAGSLEVGKDANIVVSTCDILDMSTNNIEYAFITGRDLSLDNKNKQLYRRFQAKFENQKK